MALKVNCLQVKVVPTSPLAQAQNMDDLDSVLQFAQIAQAFGQAGQMAINQEEMLTYVAEKMGVPQKLLTSPEQKEQMMMEMQQMMIKISVHWMAEKNLV
ncbi:MAG TPA: hypothetical protein DCE62_07480 [Glaciecola sp.]|nr:hypothetical protein [Glaciecola sp.]